MTAKEMFEELGYEQYEEHDDYADRIIYTSKEDDDVIIFYYDSKTFYIGEYILCGVKLLKAINKQVEELGWDNE